LPFAVLGGLASLREVPFFDILGKRDFARTPKSTLFDLRIVASGALGAICGPNVKMGKAKRTRFLSLFSETRRNARLLVGT